MEMPGTCWEGREKQDGEDTVWWGAGDRGMGGRDRGGVRRGKEPGGVRRPGKQGSEPAPRGQ